MHNKNFFLRTISFFLGEYILYAWVRLHGGAPAGQHTACQGQAHPPPRPQDGGGLHLPPHHQCVSNYHYSTQDINYRLLF